MLFVEHNPALLISVLELSHSPDVCLKMPNSLLRRIVIADHLHIRKLIFQVVSNIIKPVGKILFVVIRCRLVPEAKRTVIDNHLKVPRVPIFWQFGQLFHIVLLLPLNLQFALKLLIVRVLYDIPPDSPQISDCLV